MNFTKAEFLLDTIRQRLGGKSPPDAAIIQSILDMTIAHFNCVVGTLHRLNPKTGLLDLVVYRGIPEAVLARVREIPIGKGMAGLAAERLEPVQVCNLQTDTSGAAKPAAKLTEMEGSIAAPILVNGVLRGTIGVAMPQPHEFDEAERNLLMQIGSLIGETWPAT